MSSKTAAQMVAEAKQRIDNLSVDEVAAELAAGHVTLVDIREPAELEGGSISGMVHAPRGMLEFYACPASPYHREELEPNQRIILYCASGGRSALSGKVLKDMGYEKVYNLGAFKDWAESGGQVANG